MPESWSTIAVLLSLTVNEAYYRRRTNYEGVRFHAAILDTISFNMRGERGWPEAYFRCFSAAVELAKCCEREMSEVEVEDALEAAGVLKGM